MTSEKLRPFSLPAKRCSTAVTTLMRLDDQNDMAGTDSIRNSLEHTFETRSLSFKSRYQRAQHECDLADSLHLGLAREALKMASDSTS